MDNKKNEILRKRNIELSQYIEVLEAELAESIEKINSTDYEHLETLINEIEDIRNKWLMLLNSLYEKENEYSKLIAEVRALKKQMETVEFRNFWCQKAKQNFKNKY